MTEKVHYEWIQMDVKEIQKREAEGISPDYATEHPVYMLRSALAFGEKCISTVLLLHILISF